MKLIKKYHVLNGKKYTNFYLEVNDVRIAIKPAFIKSLDTLKAIAEEEDEDLCF